MRRSGAAPGVLAILALIAPIAAVAAATSAPTPGPSVALPLTVTSGAGDSVLVDGTYPKMTSRCVRHVQPTLHARYPDTVTISRLADGTLSLIVTLPFESYLDGLAEVPPTWPTAALQAQAIAARSYALASIGWHGTPGASLSTPICSTASCQVYGGLATPNGPYGERWVAAVRATARQILVSGGRPADTVYFSTSNGHTFGNETVFGGSPLPYLRPIVERDDTASPEAHWSVRLPFGSLRSFLVAAGDWPAGRPIASVVRKGTNVVVRGGGTTRTLDVGTFVADVNAWASCLQPDAYPSASSSGGRLPQTVPSRWFAMGPSHGAVVLTGRGWGHGVGMVQWGAYGKAARGLSASQILAAYYGGLRPQPFAEPGTIRVAVASGLTSVTVTPTGTVRVGGASRDTPFEVTLATGTNASGLTVRDAAAPPPDVQSGTLTSPARATAGRRVTATLHLPQLSRVRLTLRPAASGTAPAQVLGAGDWRTAKEGSVGLTLRVPPVPTGTYRLVAQVTDGTDIAEASSPVRVLGTNVPPSTASPTGTARAAAGGGADRGRPSPFVLVAIIAAAALLLTALVTVARRRRRAGDGSTA